MAISVKGLRYEVDGNQILNDVQLEVEQRTSTAIMGPSGSGKTTLLMCLAGLLEPTSGSIHIRGQETTGRRSAQRAANRLAHIGIVYQFGELLPELTVVENVALPALLSRVPGESAFVRARSLLSDMGLGELCDRSTTSLSGGERQRAAIARALITRPAVILADEPTGALDQRNGEMVTKAMFTLPGQYDCAVVVVTHNPRVAGLAGRCLSLVDGMLSETPVSEAIA